MTIEIKKNGIQAIIEIVGRLDANAAPLLEKTINEDIADVENLIFDLSGLEYISSAGLRVILNAQKKMQQKGSMKVQKVREEVMDIFEITGFADILTIE